METLGHSLFASDLLQYGAHLTTIKALLDPAKQAGPTLGAPGTSQGLHAAPDRRMTSHQAGNGEGQGGVGNGASIIVPTVQTATRAKKGRHRPANKMLLCIGSVIRGNHGLQKASVLVTETVGYDKTPHKYLLVENMLSEK
jgi:hypothetical protein